MQLKQKIKELIKQYKKQIECIRDEYDNQELDFDDDDIEEQIMERKNCFDIIKMIGQEDVLCNTTLFLDQILKENEKNRN
jgi:hypothetical protein